MLHDPPPTPPVPPSKSVSANPPIPPSTESSVTPPPVTPSEASSVPSNPSASSVSPNNSGEEESSSTFSAAIEERMEQLRGLKEMFQKESRRLMFRYFVYGTLFLLMTVALFYILRTLYARFWGVYATLENISIIQSPENQGLLEISYDVVKPGRVYCRRESGELKSDLICDYKGPFSEHQKWNWNYIPGQEICVTLWSRTKEGRKPETKRFPTSEYMDIIILLDTTESMDASIQTLREKCKDFALDLEAQNVKPRFMVIAFGDVSSSEGWIENTPFMEDAVQFENEVDELKRFEGGDEPESVLDALLRGVELVEQDAEKESEKNRIRRFYLVTDQTFHPQTADGKLGVAEVAKILQEKKIMLEVFSDEKFREAYAPLLGESCYFRKIEDFGSILSSGRFFED